MKQIRKSILFVIIMAFSIITGGCSNATKAAPVENAFSYANSNSSGNNYTSPISYAKGFASDLGVVAANAVNSDGSDSITSHSALLVRVSDGEVLFQKNAHDRMYPASTTKIMTALLALEYGDTTATRTVGEEVNLEGENIVMADFRVGDEISFDIALHGALLRSGNDAAAFLSTFVTDDMDEFVSLMNEKAQELGATNTHFVNPHGLHDDNHYTTAYDLYLIFNEAVKNSVFRSVIHESEYFNTFTRTTAVNTYVINAEFETTNQYLNGTHPIPDGVTIIGGKSGFTNEATANYICLFQKGGEEYIVCVMGASDKELMYDDMDYLMNRIEVSPDYVEEETESQTEETSASDTTAYGDDESQFPANE